MPSFAAYHDADDLWYDGDREEIVLSIEGHAQPFTNLSAGQRMMVALVADVATKVVMQNSYLVSDARLDDDRGSHLCCSRRPVWS